MRASDLGAADALVTKFGYNRIVGMSALWMPGARMTDVLGNFHVPRILEIGTYQGITAAVLAEHADHLITLDFAPQPICGEVWDFFGARDKIEQVIVRDDSHKCEVVRNLNFDMAFIDGSHSRACVIFDFAITKGCGCLLFHDYPCADPLDLQPKCGYRYYDYDVCSTSDGAGYLLDVIGPAGTVERHPPFAWWRAK